MKTSVQEILCWTLLHFLWQATAIAGFYKCVDWCMPSSTARKRYTVALIALLAMFATAVGTIAYETFRIANNRGAAEPSPFSYGMGLLATGATRVGSPALLAILRGSDIPLCVDAIWFFGVLAMSIRALGGLWFLARLRASMCLPAPAKIVEHLSILRKRMQISRHVVLRMHAAVSSPFVIGALRPVIYVPLSFLGGLTSEQIEMILAHELAHIARADYVWNAFQVLMETLFFFHPAVWWIGSVLRDQREHSCDDMVLESFAHPRTYVTALLALAENSVRSSPFAMGLAGQHPSLQLLSRVARILGSPINRARQFGPGVVLKLSIPVIAGLTLLFCTLAAPVGGMSPPLRVEAFSQALDAPKTPDVSVPAARMSQRRSRALTSSAKLIAEALAPKRASAGATEQTASKLADDYITNMRASPSIVQISPSAMRVSGAVIDARALAEQAVPAVVAEQLKLHPRLRLDRRSVAPPDEGSGPDEDLTRTNTTTDTDTTN
jgi:beta-lactamase regulating signal transducer with metallopeptidase domain